MFKDLMLNINNIETVINNYFKERYSNYTVTINEKKTKKNNTVYDVNFDGRYLFLSVFITNKGKVTLKVKEGKEQEEKLKLAEYITNSSICKINRDTKNKHVTLRGLKIDEFQEVIEAIESEEWCDKCNLELDDSTKKVYKVTGVHRDVLTVTYFKTTKNTTLQGLPLEVFNHTIAFFNELLELDEVVNTMNEVCGDTIKLYSIEEKYKCILPHSHNKHNEKLKKSLIKSVYNLESNSQDLTCTELIFEPLRALEGHIIITLDKDYGIIKPYKNNLSMFKYDEETDKVSFRRLEYEEIIKSKDDKIDYYKKAYAHIIRYRHRYFHWNWNSELAIDTTLHLDDVITAKQIINDTLNLIDEYYM